MFSDSLRINTNKYPNFLWRQSKALMFKLYRIFSFSNHIPNEKLYSILFHAIVESPANDFKNIVERTEPSPPIQKLQKENSNQLALPVYVVYQSGKRSLYGLGCEAELLTQSYT